MTTFPSVALEGFPALKQESVDSTDFSEAPTFDFPSAESRNREVVFEGPVLGPQKDQGPDWTGLIWDRTAVLVLP